MSDNPLARRINTYFSVLIVTVFGSGASLIIIHAATNISYTAIGMTTVAYAATFAH